MSNPPIQRRGQQGELVKVQFHDDVVEAVWWNGQVWISVRRICQSLGIDRKAQQDRLKESPWAVGGLIPLAGSDGKTYATYCLALDSLPMWLATIDSSRVAVKIRPKLAIYQCQVAEVLRKHFFGGQSSEQIARLPVYTRRLSMAFQMAMTVPEGYWTIFDKCSNLLILVEIDLQIPVERFDLLDGSVGIRYARYRKGKPWARHSLSYTHMFPDRRGERVAHAYHVDELGQFDLWLRNIYIPRHLPEYLDGKYSLPLPARKMIARILGPNRPRALTTGEPS